MKGLEKMATAQSSSVYLVGATWCGYSKKADAELTAASSADVAMQVQQYPVNDVINRVFCDEPNSDLSVPQQQLCGLAQNGFPILAVCQGQNCTRLLDGYYPNYAKASSDAINRYASQ
jgi:hypothetical protein